MPDKNKTSRKAKGKGFKPREPYTHRLRKILEEYPDGSQVLREILQNSDDAKSTEQIFILDHNTYASNSLFEPDLDNYQGTNLRLDRYQGPALLARNNTIFEERDFQSLIKLADSEKRNQYDKIGVMGVGFNSIYHITDSPSFITGDKYVILDPHEWYFDGGVKYDFVEDKLADYYPDQFSPFGIPCNKLFKGTIFRYPLRTSEDSIDSEISDKIYKPEEILAMFQKFYENESVNCLLFLKYIERICFYELKEGATKPELLYTIQLDNARQVQKQRHLIVENIIPMMNALKSGKLDSRLLESSYIASFSRRQEGNHHKELPSSWLILNYLDDLNEAKAHFQEEFGKNIGDYKFIPNVGLAVPLNNLNNTTGKLFCFLPLPGTMPFRVSVHGYFAVSTNRRSLWSAADNEDLADDALARLKVMWNRYLFERVLPKAWVKFLCELPIKIPNIQPDDLYKFWPIIEKGISSSRNAFCKGLLQNVINCLNADDRVFQGPSLSNNVGEIAGISSTSYKTFSSQKFHWLSLSNGYFDEKSFSSRFSEIIGRVGFPVISVPFELGGILKDSKHKDSINYFSPSIIRTYLNNNRDRWEDREDPKKIMKRGEILELFNYILKDSKFDELVGFKMIPLADGTLGTLTKPNNSFIYIGPDDDNLKSHKSDEHNIFKNQLNKFIDKSIDLGLYKRLYDSVKSDDWNLNIKILDESDIANMIKLKFGIIENDSSIENINFNDEIDISDRREFIYQLWENFKYRNWNLKIFEEIHLIPTNRSTLRKLKTAKKIFLTPMGKNTQIKPLISVFEKFGAIFVEDEFGTGEIPKWNKISSYVIKPDDIIAVLHSFRVDNSFPNNLNQTLKVDEASEFAKYLSVYSQLIKDFGYKHIETIKHLPIFIEVDKDTPIPLLPGDKCWRLLPKDDEESYGKIIYPSNKGGFLSTNSQNLHLLEVVIKVPRLESRDYWRKHVIPFIESQEPHDIDIVIDKLFDRWPSINDDVLNDNLKNISFVPSGTIKMSQTEEIPSNLKLVRPTELFDPEKTAVVDLFFEDEQVFPAGKYGSPSKKFLSILRSLGIKSDLPKDGIIPRINSIVNNRKNSNVQENCIYDKALNFFKYIDEKWDDFNIDCTRNRANRNQNIFERAILEKEWIPTFDSSGKIIFSKPENCYHQKYKDLVCLVSPIIKSKVKNRKFLKLLGWDTHPKVAKVLKQFELCYIGVTHHKHPPDNLEGICMAIYKYMNEAFEVRSSDEKSKSEFEIMRRALKNNPWILREGKFYPAEKMVFNLQSKFQGDDPLVFELPAEYTSNFNRLFKYMGVRDEIGIKDLISITKNMIKGDKNKVLSSDEINRIIRILEQIVKIQKENKREGNKLEDLDELLLPNNKNMLVDIREIKYDDMEDRLDDDEKSKYEVVHYLVTRDIAKELKIQFLGNLYGSGNCGEMDWERYEQSELLTTRIRNIIEDYPISSSFKEFLQNADDAGATQFFIVIDERKMLQNRKSLLSEEMEGWQGPAMWIYNNAEFTTKDFQSLIKLGIGGKSGDDTKIGRFGIGINCAFHFTDLISVVSGEYIVFLDPNAKFLPEVGQPLARTRGTRLNFIERKFKKLFPDQCRPYEALGCDFSKEFKGTLFRLPLRTNKLAEQSEISNRVISIKEIFNNFQSNNEMLFLRNVESCKLYRMTDDSNRNLVWEVKINITDDCRNIRKSVINKPRLYQLDIETNIPNEKKDSEIWLLCTGGHDNIHSDFDKLTKERFESFSEERRLKPRGGVAALLAKSDEKSFDELRAESFPNPPDDFTGEIYNYLSLSMSTNLSVHLNGNFSLSSARKNIIQSETDFLKAGDEDSRWNQYILFYVLPDLHIKLLDEIVNLEKKRRDRDTTNFCPHTLNNLWPTKKNLTAGFYKSYGLNIIKKICLGKTKFFWTEANGGNFVSLKEGVVNEGKDQMVANILTHFGVSTLNIDEDKLKQFDDIAKLKKSQDFAYKTINGQIVCEALRMNKGIMYTLMQDDQSDRKQDFRDLIIKLLNFILRDNNVSILNGLPLVPLCNNLVGDFGHVYYIGEQKHLDLFPKSGPSKFVYIDLPRNLLDVFNNPTFSDLTNIRQFDASAILDLLSLDYQRTEELDWDPNDKSIPNSGWLKEIWSKFITPNARFEFGKLSKFPLLPIIQPYEKLVQLDTTNPLISISEYDRYDRNFYPVLVKLRLRFTNMNFPSCAHSNLRQCVLSFDPVNIINSLEKNRLSLGLTSMHKLFENSELSPKDYEKFRNYIQENIEALIRNTRKQDFLNILCSLPIWPIHSCDDKFIDAKSGILLPFNLPFFSFQKNTDFYECKNETEFSALFRLNAKYIDELEYVKDYFMPHLNYLHTKPSQEYITFLQSVLSLERKGILREIENFFKEHPVIPNKSLNALVKANTLYDISVPLFCLVFEDTDKFLPPQLQDPKWKKTLENIGLKCKVDANAFIECAQEIESQFEGSSKFQMNVVKNRAKTVINHLYAHVADLKFSPFQWDQIMQIKFVPSETYFQDLLYEKESKETSGFECFEALCFQKYKEVCWTQVPLFESSVEPSRAFKTYCPKAKIGKPSSNVVIDHWFLVIKRINSNSITWKSSENYRTVKEIIKKVYEIMNEYSGEQTLKKSIESKIKTNDKLFLNGEDLFDRESWVAGNNIVFGVEEDVRKGLNKVHEFLIPYKNLLMLAGAHELKQIKVGDISHKKHDQKDLLLNNLLSRLVKHPDTKHHDVIFVFYEEKLEIGANRYVLSAASEYFKTMFCGRTSESKENGPVRVRMDDIQSNSFQVFLRWLYGQSFEEASSIISREQEAGQEDYDSYYLSFLVNLLKITDMYGVEPLKDQVEITIIKGRYININNVTETLVWAIDYKVPKLKDHCKEFIKQNRSLIIEGKLESCKNAFGDEKQENLEMLNVINDIS